MEHTLTLPDSKHNKPHDFIKAVLFDLDGTLVNSTLDFSLIRRELCCPVDQDILSFVEKLSPKKQQAAHALIRRHELHDANMAAAIPGAINLLRRLQQLNIKTGIVTRNSLEATHLKIERTGIQVEKILTREDAPAKPDPAGLLQLSNDWGLHARQCVYVGDYLYDLQAAHNAMMHACLFSQNTLPVFADMADFVCTRFDTFISSLNQYIDGPSRSGMNLFRV